MTFLVFASGCGFIFGDPAEVVPPPESTPVLLLVAGAEGTDTIGAAPAQGLVVRVYGKDAKPTPGVEVRFEAVESRILVGGVAEAGVGPMYGTETDARGEATVRINFGDVAGPGEVLVTVPAYGLSASAPYTVVPGGGVGVVTTPSDTLVQIDAVFAPNAAVVDRGGNRRSDPVYVVSSSPSLRLVAGVVRAVAFGKGIIVARAVLDRTMPSDTTAVTAVPMGEIAYTDRSPLYVGDLAGVRRAVTTRPAISPSWAPNGQEIVFVNRDRLFITDLDGVDFQIDTGLPSSTWPVYSPDGRWIFFEGAPSAEPPGVYRIRRDGTGLERINPSLTSGRAPTVSPDGLKIAYILGIQLVAHDLATGVETVLVASGGNNPAWSPDGAWIAYSSENHGELHLVRPDGSGDHRVGEHGLFPGLAWSPDSRWLAGTDGRLTLVDIEAGVMIDLPVQVEGTGLSWGR